MSNAEVRIVYIDMLPEGTDLPRTLVQEYRGEVEDAILWLPPGVICNAGGLARPKFWLPKPKFTRSKLGKFLAHWVARGELPLEFVGSPRRPNKRYRLRQ